MNKLVKKMCWKYGVKFVLVKLANGSFKWMILSLAIDATKFLILNL